MSRVLRLPENKRGRTFVVGDIHGCFDQVLRGMDQVKFDPNCDRLISVGDLIDRGPDSHRTAKFLKNKFVHAILGNHEQMLLDIYAKGEPHPAMIEFAAGRNGFGWWVDTPDSIRQDVLDAVRTLPHVIETTTPRGTVGFVHADIIAGMDWQTFLQRIEEGHSTVLEAAIWERTRSTFEDQSGVAGIGRVYVGHTPVQRVQQLGNMFNLDTGAVFGVLKPGERDGRLTFVNIDVSTEVLLADPVINDARVDVKDESPTPTTPFSDYVYYPDPLA